jgi:hypothetical protein
MRALSLHAGPLARQWIARNGLQARDITTIPGAAGGPKGLILGPLDRWLFGEWLSGKKQVVDLVGASIGAWRMATACLDNPVPAFQRLETDYIRQHYELAPGQKRPTPDAVSESFGQNLRDFYSGRVAEILQQPRYRLHVMTSRGRHVLRREQKLRTVLGYAGAFLSNGVHRKALGAWLERVVFSSEGAALPFASSDYRTRQFRLMEANFHQVLQASCSIPFVLRAVHDISGAPRGAYWDGGITDYHLHLDYRQPTVQSTTGSRDIAQTDPAPGLAGMAGGGLVLYPHFQRAVVPGWLDKGLPWRHKPTGFLDTTIVLAPNPEWVKTLPNGKLPDRTDFAHYGNDLAGRVKAWSSAASASEQLVDEFAHWVQKPDSGLLQPL